MRSEEKRRRVDPNIYIIYLVLVYESAFRALHCWICIVRRYTWWAYILSYTSVQQMPPAYNGRQTLQSTDPATADQPRRAPQLNARPDGIEASERPVLSKEIRNIIYEPSTACGQ